MRDIPDPDLPGGLRAGRHLGLTGRTHEPWTRRVVLLLMSVLVVAAALGAVGQQARTERTTGVDGSTLTISFPDVLRSGIFFQGRLDVVAPRTLDEPTLVLGPGWAEELQINTIEPAADQEGSDDGAITLTYRRLDRGERLTVWLQFEVNPTASGRRDLWTELRDGDRILARSDRTLTILP